MEKISKYVSWKEGTYSLTAELRKMNNTPGTTQLTNMRFVASEIFDKVRAHFGVPIRVNSFFRSVDVNKAVGGVINSQHVTGEAMDISAIPGTGISNKDLFDWIKANCDFDQLLNEYPVNGIPQWVHVSLKRHGKNRKQVFTIK